MYDNNTFRNLESSLGGAPKKDQTLKKVRITLHLGLKDKQLLDQLAEQLSLSLSAYIRFLINQQNKVQPTH